MDILKAQIVQDGLRREKERLQREEDRQLAREKTRRKKPKDMVGLWR